MQALPLYSVVATLEDIPELGLARGQVGTVVDVHTPTVVEVEFSDKDGHTYAMGALSTERLVLLLHEPLRHVA